MATATTADDRENLLFYWWNDWVLCAVMVDQGSVCFSMWACVVYVWARMCMCMGMYVYVCGMFVQVCVGM